MNKEQLLALGLNEEQVVKVLDAFKGYIPPARFNEVNEAKKNAETQLAERDKQLTELKANLGENKELLKQIETLQAENKAAKEKFDADLNAFKLNNAVDLALAKSGAKNLKAVRALIELDKLKLDGDNVLGLEDQIKALKGGEDSKFLFNADKPAQGAPAGMRAGEGAGGNNDRPLSLADAIAQKLHG